MLQNSTSRAPSSLEDDCMSPVQIHALQLALKTMNERCQQLQQRLISVEEENLKLKSQRDKDCNLTTDYAKRPSEYEMLKDKVEELNRQKNQLTQHINMVATENRHLWTRLSKMTKDNHSLSSQSSKLLDSIEQPTSIPKPQSHHHIIRSKTFTQSTPNSKLCPKISSESDLSLEEISLKLINNFIQDKSVLEEQYEQMIEMHSDLESDEAPLKNIGFSYITDGHDDSGVALNQCTEGFKDVRKQVLEQKNCLNEMLNLLRNQIKDKPVCTKCQKSIPDLNTTPENDSLFKECLNETKWATPISSASQDTNRGPSNNLFRPISEDNLKTDGSNDSEENYETMISKICPMCKKEFPDFNLNDLTEHVNGHFSEENNMAIDSNFEIVTHTVGNF